MTPASILLPLFVEVALTFALLGWMGRLRVPDARSGRVRAEDVTLGQPGWSTRATQVGNSFNNQFQLPVLFYVLTALAMVTRKADLLFVVLAWVFVATRIVHAFIHTGGNDLRQRFGAFLAGVLVLMVMWLIFAVQILTGL